MYSNIVRDNIYRHNLTEFIKSEYGIKTIHISAAERGFYGETWKLNTQKADYFLKMVYCDDHKYVYERSFSVIQHLCDHGIDFISRIVKSKSGELSTHFDGAVIGVFNWIEGENIETDATKESEYQMLAKVYAVAYDGLNIPEEDFSYRYSDEFFTRWATLSNRQTLSLLKKNRQKLEHRAKRLNLFSRLCRDDKTDFVITHGDAGGNFIMSSGRNFIVDWDGAVLAPPERDAWVMCGHKWARDAFNNALRQNGIAYSLRLERLAYYCYRFFFFYLNAFVSSDSQADILEEYIDSWIEDSIRWADGLHL
ncbi:MAG: aminoglycoside phosphotransferase family protein [Oscillospiraceae bacterium]|jgi:hypothetical protein|nr:aminoglycoside phosphotransferase family protein [Oscillospiraceae bacterium]